MGWSLKYLGNLTQDDHLNIYLEGKCVLSEDRVDLQKAWNEVSWQIARMRDNPECADSEYALISDKHNGGLVLTMGFDPEEKSRCSVYQHRRSSESCDFERAGR